jgi:hypothetical protein
MLVQRKIKGTPKFPTWSWAGWKGRVTYEEPFDAGLDKNGQNLRRYKLAEDEGRRLERLRPLIRWHVKRPDGELEALNRSGW